MEIIRMDLIEAATHDDKSFIYNSILAAAPAPKSALPIGRHTGP